MAAGKQKQRAKSKRNDQGKSKTNKSFVLIDKRKKQKQFKPTKKVAKAVIDEIEKVDDTFGASQDLINAKCDAEKSSEGTEVALNDRAKKPTNQNQEENYAATLEQLVNQSLTS